MAADPLSLPLVLRPGLRSRVIYLVLVVGVCALAAAGAFTAPPALAVLLVLFALAALVNACARAFHPLAYATRLQAERFEVFDWRGRPVHDVRWEHVAHLTFFHGNGLRGAGTELFLAWRCEPRRPGHGRQPWVRGGRNSAGDEFDGALPDAYRGIEEMLALFDRLAREARAGTGAGP